MICSEIKVKVLPLTVQLSYYGLIVKKTNPCFDYLFAYEYLFTSEQAHIWFEIHRLKMNNVDKGALSGADWKTYHLLSKLSYSNLKKVFLLKQIINYKINLRM